MNKKIINIIEILKYLDSEKIEYEFCGNDEISICGFSSLGNYKEGTITWVKDEKKYIEFSKKYCNVQLVVSPKFCGKYLHKNVIFSPNPKYVFFKILDNFYIIKKENGISINTIIPRSAKIGKNVEIGHYTVLGENVVIGDNTIIGNNVDINDNVKIGTGCIIKSGARIGGRGFGYSINNDGEYERVPHYGGVEIGNNVDIGANTCIERGVIDDTVIKNGVKIDDLCQISHNCVIGENTTIVTNSSIYGSCKIGKNCNIVSSIVRNQITVGNNVIVGMGSVVTKDVEDNKIVFGIPAKEK